ncbi:MAG TPA: SPOR domain-containing protein [Anseongella sp.]|nr:SPOR domain-containing protein [Anseongella sp.]
MLLSTVILLFCASGLLAQERGKVEEAKDPEIDALIAKRTALFAGPREVRGYRVQLYSGPDRQVYIQMKQKYRNLYPQGASYLKYEAPNFRLQAGNCETLAEANRLKEILAKDFEGATVVEETVVVNAEGGGEE